MNSTMTLGPSRASRRLVAALLAAGFLPLTACSTIDQFGNRAERLNVQSAEAKGSVVLANVVRAAQGRPLQFSDVSQVVGQATLQGQSGSTLPFDVDPDATARTFSVTPQITASGQSQFTVGNLNTREFYNGLQAPVSVANIANLIASGYDPALVLFLTVSEIEVRGPKARASLKSSAVPIDAGPGGSRDSYRLFYQAVRFLVEAGISTRSGKASFVGPSLTPDKLTAPEVLSAQLTSTGSDLSIVSENEQATAFRLQRKGSLEFCFDVLKRVETRFNKTSLPDRPYSPYYSVTTHPPGKQGLKVPLIVADGSPVPAVLLDVDPYYLCQRPADAKTNPDTQLEFRTRSVEGIFQFLGDVTRRQLDLAGTASGGDDMSVGAADGRMFFPFRVLAGVPQGAALTVTENQGFYSVVLDPSGKVDQSTRVIQILTDLLALQSSAKDLPVPSVISVLGR
jgi:hypothetical protein